MDRTKMLKVKIKSLAAEAAIIRMEERRARERQQYDLMDALYLHRVRVVRAEARVTLMAYGLLRGRDAASIEPNARRPLDMARVEAMMKRYGPQRVPSTRIVAVA